MTTRLDTKDISGKLFQLELVRGDKEKYPLMNTWILWYHEAESTDWSLESYKKIYEFNTVEDFLRLYNNLPSIVNTMFFLMKKGHPPIWEVPQNINGGSWLYKFPKKMADCFWTKFSIYLIGETLMADTSNIIGLSISPKVYNVTIRIWNSDSDKCKEIPFNENYVELTRGMPLYKEFRSKKDNKEFKEANKEAFENHQKFRYNYGKSKNKSSRNKNNFNGSRSRDRSRDKSRS